MKKFLFLIPTFMMLLSSCVEKFTPRMEIDENSAKSSYGTEIKISPADDSVKISKNKIVIAPDSENAVYTISGYFNGQIVVNTKNTEIKLQNAYLENTSGKSAIKANAKTEISSVKDSVNFIVSRGRGFSKNAALSSSRSLILGGSGTLNVKGKLCHAIEAEDVKIKGSGVFFLEGTKKGSALNCETLEIEKDKTFSAYFLNSKNGLKADKTITIASGNFHFYNNDTAIKTETTKTSPKNAHGIKLSGGNFYFAENAGFVITDDDAFDAEGANIIQE